MRLGYLLSLVTLVKVFGLPFISLTPSPIDTQWLAMDTGSVRALTGVATQGSAPTEEWVWLCTLNVRNDNSTWTYVSFISMFIYLSIYVYIYIYIYIYGYNGWLFPGNVGMGNAVVSSYFSVVWTRYIRIEPIQWVGHIRMRAGVYIQEDCS